MNYTFY